MQSPSVSGTLTYKELCVAAKNEKRLAQLRKRQQYVTHQSGLQPSQRSFNSSKKSSDQGTPQKTSGNAPSRPAVRCYKCNKVGHYAKDCRSRKTESSGEKLKATNMKQVILLSLVLLKLSREQILTSICRQIHQKKTSRSSWSKSRTE